MIDSVLKGTGNSRFLKSAVPAGTSWADALAMLQAGTFPIDFNGINTEGFQQVGTPLNKANLLKDATAAQIGLPPSTTPDGMFSALANTGELHVWRKTVVTTEPIPEVPAGYNLGTAAKTAFVTPTNSSNSAWIYKLSVSKTVFVDSSGNVSLVSPETKDVIVSGDGTVSVDSIIGSGNRFFSVTNAAWADRGTINIERNVVYYVAPGTTFTYGILSSRTPSYFDAAQKVVGYPVTPEIPAGTTTTYPVSTNPNAYQEGDDAKEAGYVVGDATSMKIISYAGGSGYYVRFYTADSVSVSDSGALSIVEDNNSAPLISKSSDGSELRGKYIKYHSSYQASTEIVSGMIYFVPSNAVFTWSNGILICDKVQLVTGYPAIPAGTTIEYLGKLGDKARVQVVSYVGTGTYGSGKETKIPVDFSPELLIIAVKNAQRRTVYISVPRSGTGLYLSADGSSSIYGESEATVSYVDGKVCIQSYNNEYGQMNVSGYTYIAVALG